MLIQSTINHGFADVSDSQGEALLATSEWKRPRKPSTPKHSKTAPVEEPSTKE